MAMTIGQVNFDVDADTQGLKDAINTLMRFKSTVDAAAKANSKASAATVSAYARQESSIKRAFQQTLELRRQLRNAGADSTHISRVTVAFKTLAREMSSGVLNQVEFNRAQDAYYAKINRSARAMRDMKAATQGVTVGEFTQAIRNLESASVLAVGPLSGLGSRIRAIAAISNRSTLALAAFVSGVTLGGLAMTALTRNAITTAIALEKIEAAFLTATGSSFAAASELDFVIARSRELGLELERTATQYSRFVAASRETALAGEGVRQVFTGVTSATAALKLNADETAGIFRALTQILSKGKVQSEELRGQIGERLPGAYQIAAAAMGVTTAQLNKMLERGQVMSEDFLPKFAAKLEEVFGKRAKEASEGLVASINRLSTEVTLFNKAFDDTVGASTAFQKVVNLLSSGIRAMSENMVTTISAVGALTGAMLGLAGPAIVRGLVLVVNTIRTMTAAVLALNVAVLANPMGAFLSILGRVALSIAGAVGGYYAMQAALEGTTNATDDSIAATQRYIDAMKKVEDSSASLTRQYVEDTKKRLKALQAELAVARAKFAEIIEQGGALRLGNTPDDTPVEAFMPGGDRLRKRSRETQQRANEYAQLIRQEQELQRQLAELEALPTSPSGGGFGGGSGDVDKKALKRLEKFREGVEESLTELQELMRVQSEINLGATLDDIIDSEALAQVRAEIAKLSPNQVIALEEHFRGLGYEVQSLELFMSAIANKTRDAEDAIEDWKEKLEATPEIMREVSTELQNMERELAAIRQGADAVKDLEQAFKDEEAVRKFREELEKTTLSVEAINALVEKFRELREEINSANEELERQQEIIDNIERIAERAFDNIGDAFVDAFVRGKEEALDFGRIMEDLIADITRQLLDSLLLDPLKDDVITGITDIVRNIGGGGGSTGGGGFSFGGFGDLFSGIGSFFGFAQGGSFQVQGAPGTDNNLVAFRASGGERVDVLTRRQQRMEGSGNGGNTFVISPVMQVTVESLDPSRAADVVRGTLPDLNDELQSIVQRTFSDHYREGPMG